MAQFAVVGVGSGGTVSHELKFKRARRRIGSEHGILLEAR
jgi:hypothetical protein